MLKSLSICVSVLCVGLFVIAQPSHTTAKKAEPKKIYALVWHQTGTDQEFQSRIPRLFAWLKQLYASGHLIGCGGGEWQKDSSGAGLTLISASSFEEAQRIGSGQPMNEVGHTDIMEWECFFGKLNVREREAQLKK